MGNPRLLVPSQDSKFNQHKICEQSITTISMRAKTTRTSKKKGIKTSVTSQTKFWENLAEAQKMYSNLCVTVDAFAFCHFSSC